MYTPILFIIRLIIHLFIFFACSLPLQIAGIFLLLPICYLSKSNELPIWVRWYDSADWYLGRDVTTISLITKQGWWTKYCWLAWRNPINYFEYKYLGFMLAPPFVVTNYFVNGNKYLLNDIGDSTNDQAGFFYLEILMGSKVYYEYYGIWLYPSWMPGNRCFRFRLGWKINQDPYQSMGYTQEVLTVNPWCEFDGLK